MAPTVNNLSVVLFIFISFLSSTLSIILKYPAIVNFGDSNSDTGNLISAGIESVNPPYGQTYFKLPSGRYCDGRLIVDFLCIYKFLQMQRNRCCSSLKQLFGSGIHIISTVLMFCSGCNGHAVSKSVFGFIRLTEFQKRV